MILAKLGWPYHQYWDLVCILIAIMNMSCSQRGQLTQVGIYCMSFSAHTPVRALPELLVKDYSSDCRIQVTDAESLREFEPILQAVDTSGSVVDDGGFDARVLGLFYFRDGHIDTVAFGKWNMYYRDRTYEKVDSVLLKKLLEYTDESQTDIEWFRGRIRRLGSLSRK